MLFTDVHNSVNVFYEFPAVKACKTMTVGIER